MTLSKWLNHFSNMNIENPTHEPTRAELEALLTEKRKQRALHASGGDVEERLRLDEEIAALEEKLY